MTWLAYSHLGVAKTVQLTTQPAVALAGIPFGVQPVGRLVDGSGVLSRATGVTVTASKASGTGTLSGTLSVQTVEGVFTFTNLKMDTVTSAVTLSFASSGLTSATSNPFNVTQPNTIIGCEVGSYAVTGTAQTLTRGPYLLRPFAPGSYAVTGTALTLTYSGVAEPTPSGTIFLDMRAGGAQSIQAMSTVDEVDALTGWTRFADGYSGIQFSTDYDGAGKHALRFDWTAAPGVESNRAWLFQASTSYPNLYVSVVIHLGKTATGGGTGTVGSFVASQSPTAKLKRLFMYRLLDDGTGRLLWNWPDGGEPTGDQELQHPGVTPTLYFNADYGIAEDVRWTWELLPGTTSTARLWRNGVLVYENLNAQIGTEGFRQFSFPSNRWNVVQDETEYWTDLVMWSV